MFKFLKSKIESAVSRFAKKAEKETAEEREMVKEPEEKKTAEKREAVKEPVEKKAAEEGGIVAEPKEKKRFFARIKEKVTTKKISAERFEELFSDLELALLESNVAAEVVRKIKEDLKVDMVDVPLKKSKIEDIILDSLRRSIRDILTLPMLDIFGLVKNCRKEGKPCVLLILGYNGSGKSITAAKLAKLLKDKGLIALLAAGDTFRAAGAEQLGEYGRLANVPVIQRPGDSCALIYDAIAHAKAKHYDAVIADTAGRIHSNKDLMDELVKIVRVNKPDLKILVLDALSGSDIVEQAREFDRHVGVDAVIITKVDAYEKGGSILSAAYILRKPILFFGCGQKMDSLKMYDVEDVMRNLGI